MSYDSGAVATQLLAVLDGLTNMGDTQIGAPESISTRICGYVTLGSIQETRKASGAVRRQVRYFVMLAYRIEGAEATAEAALMANVDEFMIAINADKTLAGTVADAEAQSQAADEPEYQLRAGKEFREYPIMVTVSQEGTYTVNP